MRVFIAIDLSREIRKALGNLQQQIKSKADTRQGDVKWVEPENIHLTLKFLGEVEDRRISQVCDIVKDAAGRHKRFELEVASVGCFGGKSARVLWVAAGEESSELKQLQQDIENSLASAGWPPEARQFTGHLTLCRIRNSKAGVKLAQLAQAYEDFELGTMSADSVCVYQSQLKPTGPVYTVLADFKLQ